MLQSKECCTLNEMEMKELPQISPDDFAKQAYISKTLRSPWICNFKKWIFHILLVIASIAIVVIFYSIDSPNSPDFDQSNLEQGNFPFLVHCPYSYKLNVKPVSLKDNKNGDLRRRRLHSTYSYNVELLHPQKYLEYDWSNTYIVDMQSRKNEETGEVFLYYCGIVTNIGSTCDDQVFQACSIPGPMFDLKINQHVDIIWINNLNKDIYIPNGCFAKDSSSQCHLKYKPSGKIFETFADPLSHDAGHKILLTPETWPASPHVHGAEVRPTFDGNPLSWIANDGSRGLGAFSLSDKCYYEAFDQHKSSDNTSIPPEVMIKRIENDKESVAISQAKINRYLNIQNPGILFYHDHAMNLTRYNVLNGLSGIYILRDPKVQKEIGVHQKNEKLVMFTREGLKHTQNLESATDVVNRFRFINNKFHSHPVFSFSFIYGNSCDNLTLLIPFTIIGTDSSLFHEGLQNQTTFALGQAERIELLIKFEPNHHSYSICRIQLVQTAGNTDEYNNIKSIQGIQLFHRSQYEDFNHRKYISNVKLSVPYTDLKEKDHSIAVRRMKPILYNTEYRSYSFGGRYEFHSGKTDYPVIGTTEDWYFINCWRLSHPVHVHLINMQVTKVLSLRRLKPDSLCVIYKLEYIAAAMRLSRSKYKYDINFFPNASDPRYVNYTYICNNIEALYKDQDFVSLLGQVEPENVVENGLNDIDVEKKLDIFDRQLFKILNISTNGGEGKYITDQVNTIKPYYKGWKDVVMVDGFKVLVSRIRWTKNNYKGGKDTYFNVPLDQLRQYPGFVYHCHNLKHEDNGMMRPFMLQLPIDARLNPKTPCNNVTDHSWTTKVKCLNQRCSEK